MSVELVPSQFSYLKSKNGGSNWTLWIPLFRTYFDLCDPPKFIKFGRFRRAWVWVAMVFSSSFVSHRHILFIYSFFILFAIFVAYVLFIMCNLDNTNKKKKNASSPPRSPPPHLTLLPTKKPIKAKASNGDP